jgi:hypothetical protein
MTDDEPQCSCVIDTSGLYELATASGNLRTILLDQLTKSAIAVPTCAWQEFEVLYEEEAAEIAPFVTKKIIMTKVVYLGAPASLTNSIRGSRAARMTITQSSIRPPSLQIRATVWFAPEAASCVASAVCARGKASAARDVSINRRA